VAIDVRAEKSVTGAILAGGRARRMGGRDKGLVHFRGKPLIQWVVTSMERQVQRLVISANRNIEAYATFGHPVVTDQMQGYQGPLAGLSSAIAVAHTPWIAVVPCDGPFLPPDLVQRLYDALTGRDADIAVATDGARTQVVYALLRRELRIDLATFLASGERAIHDWYALHDVVKVDFGDRPGCFANINDVRDVRAWRGKISG
jgi:molybdopterin-guanine dinucleotide biosynthesis protein A